MNIDNKTNLVQNSVKYVDRQNIEFKWMAVLKAIANVQNIREIHAVSERLYKNVKVINLNLSIPS